MEQRDSRSPYFSAFQPPDAHLRHLYKQPFWPEMAPPSPSHDDHQALALLALSRLNLSTDHGHQPLPFRRPADVAALEAELSMVRYLNLMDPREQAKAMQKLLENLKTPQQVCLIMSALSPASVALAYNPNVSILYNFVSTISLTNTTSISQRDSRELLLDYDEQKWVLCAAICNHAWNFLKGSLKNALLIK